MRQITKEQNVRRLIHRLLHAQKDRRASDCAAGDVVTGFLKDLPAEGLLFPYLASGRAGVQSRCQQAPLAFDIPEAFNSTSTACAKSGRFKRYRFGMPLFACIHRIARLKLK